jgi:hypothetical protein
MQSEMIQIQTELCTMVKQLQIDFLKFSEEDRNPNGKQPGGENS